MMEPTAPPGDTASQELPSGSPPQPLWEIREKPTLVTQKGMDGCIYGG